jgi:secreted protein with Ig-like and vWFA domain
MSFQFTYPWFLLVLGVVPFFFWQAARSYADLSPGRKKVALAARTLLVVVLALALSGVQFVRSSDNLAVIFVLDASDSISQEQKERALEFVTESLAKMKPTDRAGVVVFGSDALVEEFPRPDLKVPAIYSIPNTTCTDISQAVRLAMASFPQDAVARIVLISDGNETLGHALQEARLAGSNKVQIDTVPLESEYPAETMVDRLVARSEVKIGEPIELRLVVTSMTSQAASVRILRNGTQVDQESVALAKGKNVLTFAQTIGEPGLYEFEAIIEPEHDTIAENNRGVGFVYVRGKPRVLFVEGGDNPEMFAARALKAQDIEVETRSDKEVPTSPEEFGSYDAVVFSDLNSVYLTPEQMKMVESNTRDLGIGFCMIGGQNSFGVGGYHQTPIEKTLPVDMDIRKENRVPSLAVALVIDKSGSMGFGGAGFQKIDLAKEASCATVEMLKSTDEVAVYTFDWTARTAVPLQRARDKRAIIGKISGIGASGGTNMYPAMQTAFDALKKSRAEVKHVILLTDGQSAPGPAQEITDEMAKAKITVSSVAIGTDADRELLAAIAEIGKGVFYATEDPRHLPRIFLQDVMRASKAFIVEEPFEPILDPDSPILKGINPASVPPLLGYVATSPKETAQVPILSHKGDPVLAAWRCGLGKSVAYTSDDKARWAAHWLGWESFGKFWAQTLRWTLRTAAKTTFGTLVEAEKGTGHIVVEAVDRDGRFVNFLNLSARVVDPNVQVTNYELEQTAPGKYEATFDTREVGSYMIGVRQEEAGAVAASQTSALSIPYPPEYKDLKANTALLERMAELSGGKVLRKGGDPFRRDGRRVRIPYDLWPALLLLGALLVPIDVASRRILMRSRELAETWERIAAWARSLLPERGKISPEEETVGRLLGVKTRVAERHRPAARLDEERARTESPAAQAGGDVEAAAGIEEKEGGVADEAGLVGRLLESKRRRKKSE